MKQNQCLVINIRNLWLVIIVILIGVSQLPYENDLCYAQPQQKHFIVYGTVFDPFGNGVSNATIKIENPLTHEVITDETDENGSYSNNLANFKDGWEDGQKIIILASYNVSNSVKIFPKEEDGGERVNISLPALRIVSPTYGEILERKVKTYPVRVNYFPSISVSRFLFYIDGNEFANSTIPNATLFLSKYQEGTHILRVELIDEQGNSYSHEIYLKITKKDEGSESNLIRYSLLCAGVIFAVFVTGNILKKKRAQQKR